MDIGNRIKLLRKKNNMTQKQLSEKLGLTPKMISFYENGERIPPLDIVEKLVTIFSTSADYLIGLTSQNSATSNNNAIIVNSPNIYISQQELKLLTTFKELNEDSQDIIIGKAKELLRDQRIESAGKKESRLQQAN